VFTAATAFTIPGRSASTLATAWTSTSESATTIPETPKFEPSSQNPGEQPATCPAWPVETRHQTGSCPTMSQLEALK
jgi:hypothetical protein